MVVVSALGRTRTGSPGREDAARHHPSVTPVVGGRSTAGRITYCTGNRTSTRLRSLDTCVALQAVAAATDRQATAWGRPGHDVVAGSAEMGTKSRSLVSEPGRESAEVVAHRSIDVLGRVDEIHLVDAEDQVRNAEQGGEGACRRSARYPTRASTDDQRSVCGRGPRDRRSRRWTWPGVSARMNLRRGVEKYR